MVLVIGPDFPSGHSHSLCIRTGFGDLSIRIFNEWAGNGVVTCASPGRGEGMVILEPECGWRVVIRASIRSFVEKVGQGPGFHS